jgi:hypothetical protein
MKEQLTKKGFEDEWLKLVNTGYGFMKAYDILEDIHLKKYGDYRYSSYYSFSRARDYKKSK